MSQIQENNPHVIRARHLLVHYFQLVFEKSGLRWDNDNRAEISEIADEILYAVSDAIDAHNRNTVDQ
jgi:hypothetical protein